MAKNNSILSAAVCLLGLCSIPVSADGRGPGFEKSCRNLEKTVKSKNVKPLFSELVSAGTQLVVPDLDASCQNSTTVPVDICRLSLNVTTSATSDVLMEVWLPKDWSGRFMATGNGGIAGCVDYASLSYGASLGFATTGSNNGHSGQNGTRFLNNLEVIKDYSYRAITTSAAVGKDVTAKFYRKAHKKAYYLGCSTGGRQGFKMAQDFPEIFDGIVAGAPAFNFQGLMAWSGRFHTIISAVGPDGVPPPSSWAAIDAELLAQCDHLDGAVDGILEDPSMCNFRPEALICKPGDTTGANATCITGKQADTVRQFLSPLYGLNGTYLYPRLEPAPGFMPFIAGAYTAQQFLYTDHWYKYALYNDPNLDTSNLGPEQWDYAYKNDPTGVRTYSGDLSKLASRGAKVLHYHGLEDILISSASSNRYYDLVSRTMSMSSSELDNFYRYFRVSGMSHCRGGSGASVIGNNFQQDGSLDPTENVLMAMVKWVEEGVAPEAVIGSRVVDGKTDYKRIHCKYPLRNVLGFNGDPKNPEDWTCTL
ncbi:related to feruloyl esterase B precursor [Cephalotrichum gorgonifer]|uniref:Carboxylic ester hydrolase n=1 Tax=Cephalotrichum gorgonifer TaxID=2041049 RepID=A0AAE8MXG5_9PEZI|nr:related to feruloyl esterase B precursor [Cephalotrichum gorgonifer]